jgi:rare lipoprotein A
MMFHKRLIAALTTVIMGTTFAPLSALAESGIASLYNSGGGYTAAHKTLPFGTRVRVTNTRNGRSTVVVINDRGPFIRGRIIDLSPAAARAIGIDGIGRVSIQAIGKGRYKRSSHR